MGRDGKKDICRKKSPFPVLILDLLWYNHYNYFLQEETIMKKLVLFILAAAMTLSIAACGGTGADKGSNSDGQSSQADGAGSGEDNVGVADACALLTAIWDSYGEDDKIPVLGGGSAPEDMVENAPGTYSLEDAALLDQFLGFPQASADRIDGAASLIHMMNSNTFTCGAFHVSKTDDLSAVADALRENIQARQWMCGFPDKLIVITVGDYVISAFGKEDLINTFKTNTLAIYENAKVVYDESIVL